MAHRPFSSKNVTIPEVCLLVDSDFGLIPSFIAILEQINDSKPNVYDFSDLIYKLRQMMIKLAICTNVDGNPLISLTNLKKAEELLINRIHHGNFHSNPTKDILEELLENGIILDYHPSEKRRGNFSITVDIQSDRLEQTVYSIYDGLNKKINLPNVVPVGEPRTKNTPVKNPYFTIEKFILTSKLKAQLDLVNPSEFVLDKYPQTKTKIKNYTSDFILPLVATINNYPLQTAVYFMANYTAKQSKSLEIVNMDLDHHLPLFLTEHESMFSILKECRHSCISNISGDYFIKKLLIRIPNSSEICVIFFISFLSDIVYSKQKNLPLKKLYDNISEKYPSWEIFMAGVTKFSSLVRQYE